jgi:hypothetical protein
VCAGTERRCARPRTGDGVQDGGVPSDGREQIEGRGGGAVREGGGLTDGDAADGGAQVLEGVADAAVCDGELLVDIPAICGRWAVGGKVCVRAPPLVCIPAI